MKLMDRKSELRRKFLAARDSLPESFRKDASERICREMRGLKPLREAESIAAYRHLGAEPDIDPFLRDEIERGRIVYFPRYNPAAGGYEMVRVASFSDGFETGKFGIREPVRGARAADPGEMRMTAWLVPGVAFDKSGNRLGRGNGVYDRLLSRSEGARIGVCFSVQISEEIPSADNDVAMDYIVCEKETINCKIMEV